MNLNQEGNKFLFPVDKHRIRKFKDFRKLIDRGQLFFLSFGTVRILKNDQSILRVAVSVSKRFSKKSSERNRIKRKIIEYLRLNQHNLKGIDIWIYIRIHNNEENIIKEIKELLNIQKFH